MSDCINRPSIFIEGLPMSPTSNHIYKSFVVHGKVRRAKNHTYTDYYNVMKSHYLSNVHVYQMAMQMARQWVAQGHKQFQFNSTFYFKKERLFCKNQEPKKLDLSNRIKALHDTFLGFIKLDDKYVFRQFDQKTVARPGDEESVTIEIFPAT